MTIPNPRFEASAEFDAPPERVAHLATLPEAIPAWLRGARVERADPAWPAAGSEVRLVMGRFLRARFAARVTRDDRPRGLSFGVRTPSGGSTVTYRFEALPGGRTRFTRVVEPRTRSRRRWVHRLMNRMLAKAVPREMERHRRFVTERLTRP